MKKTNIILSVEMIKRDYDKDCDDFYFDVIAEKSFTLSERELKRCIELYNFKERDTGLENDKEYSLEESVINMNGFYYKWYIIYEEII